MSGRGSAFCLYETNRVAVIESTCAGCLYRLFQVIWVLSILILVVVFGAFRTLQTSTFIPAIQKRPDLVYIPTLINDTAAVDNITSGVCLSNTATAVAPVSSFSADFVQECGLSVVSLACATDSLSTDVMYAPTDGMESVVIPTSMVRNEVSASSTCPTATSAVLFASNEPMFIEFGFFAASDYILNYDPRNQQTFRDFWNANWFASGSSSSSTVRQQSGTSYSMTVQVVDQTGTVLSSCNGGTTSPCAFNSSQAVVLTLKDILEAAGVGANSAIPGDLDNTNVDYNTAIELLDPTFTASSLSSFEHSYRLSGLDVVAFVSYSNQDPNCVLRLDYGPSCYFSNLLRSDTNAVIYFKSMTSSTPVYSKLDVSTDSTVEALQTYYGVRVSVASSGRIYDSFNIWVVLVAVMVATMLFVVLVASMECTMFFESRVANVFACCSRGDDSAGSASTEVRRRQKRQFRKLMQELKYKYPVQRKTQDDIVTETVNLVDLHCEPVGRVDQSANTAESLAQLTSSIERKRNTLKSLLRRELQALESDAALLSKKNKKKRKNLLTKEQEAQLAARLFARSQAVSLLLNRSTLASPSDEGVRDDNLLRVMISECFGALVQVANKPGSMFEVSALKGWDPIVNYPSDAQSQEVDELLQHDLERDRTNVPALKKTAASNGASSGGVVGAGSKVQQAGAGSNEVTSGPPRTRGAMQRTFNHQDFDSSDEEDGRGGGGGGVNLKYLI